MLTRMGKVGKDEKNVTVTLKTVWQLLIKLNRHTSYYPVSNLTPTYLPERNEAWVQRPVCCLWQINKHSKTENNKMTISQVNK